MNTAPRGLHRRIFGNLKALVEQAREPDYTKEQAKSDMKWLATTEGFKMIKRKVRYKGRIIEWAEPAHLTKELPDSEGMILCITIQSVADERHLYLYEYDEKEQPFRSIGGRSKTEMVEYIAWLREQGRYDEAMVLEKKPRWKYKGGNDDNK